MSERRILVVEDEGITAIYIKSQLTSLGYQVLDIADNKEEAIRKAAEARPDLALIDIKLQDDKNAGIEAARYIREQFHIPVIYLTAYAEEDIVQRAKMTEPYAYVTKPFEPRELRVAIEIALHKHHAEAAIEQLNRDLNRRVQELAALGRAGQAIASTLDRDEILHVVIVEARELLEAEGASVLLHDADSDELIFAAVTGPGYEALLGMRMPATQGLAGHVLQTRHATLVDDAQADARFYRRIDATTGLTTRSLVSAPLIFKEKTIGVIEAINSAVGIFGEHDIEILEALARSAAFAIENAQLYQAELEQRQLVERLADVSVTLVSTLDADAVLDRILEQVSRVVPNDVSNIMLIEGDQARIVRSRGYEQFDAATFVEAYVFPLSGMSIRRQMIETGEALVVPDIHADPRWVNKPKGVAWLRSYAAAPISLHGHVIGFLNVGSASPGFFGRKHAGRLQAFAQQAAIAFENARLFSMVSHEREQLALLYRLGRELAQSLDVRNVAQWALDGLCAITGATNGLILVCEQIGRPIQLAAVASHQAGMFERLEQQVELWREGHSLAGWVIAHRQIAWVNDTARDERWVTVPGVNDNIRSALDVPLLSRVSSEETGETLVGVLGLGSDQPDFFTEEMRRLVESAASTVAIAITNAHLYQAEQKQSRRLRESQARLIHAEKMSALGRLTASIAHEINNPLQAVQSCMSVIKEGLAEGDDPQEIQRDLDMAMVEIERIAAIVSNLRDFYRPARQELGATDVNAVLRSVLELTRKRLEHAGVTVENQCGQELLTVFANPDLLKQVFVNLVINAVDAMPDGGHLRLITGLEPAAGQDTQVRIDITDSGQGIPAELLPRIFEPFFTTRPGGAGLGLSINYEIIQALNGEISVASQPGEGTTFTIWLPVHQA